MNHRGDHAGIQAGRRFAIRAFRPTCRIPGGRRGRSRPAGSRLLGAVSLLVALVLPAQAALGCTGDCDGSGVVAISELVTGVGIALGRRPTADCDALDRDRNGSVSIEEIVGAVASALAGCPVEPIFPADYRGTYLEVRDCRVSIAHGSPSVRVLANPLAAGPYQDEENPLPVGSIVIKEEYDGAECENDGELIRWRVMRKEAPGFDPEDGDWHWQWVEPDRSVRFDDKSTCIGCHTAPDCLARDHVCAVSDDPPRGRLEMVLEELPAALLSVSGTGPEDVLAVGADPGDGLGPLVLHYDGTRWERLRTEASGDLWWVSVAPIGGEFYMAGEGGLVLRYDPAERTFARDDTPDGALLYGVWGDAADDLWAVGAGQDEAGVAWHFDGDAWSPADLAMARPEGVPGLFKVWGRSADDVYAVGRRGVVLHFDGSAWSEIPNAATAPHDLFTVHGNASIVAACGGELGGVILERESDAFVDRTPPGTEQMNGVFVPNDGRAVAVGSAGAVAIRKSGGWEVADSGLDTIRDFHAVWVDPAGGIWAVGGDLSPDLTAGMLAYGGRETISSTITVVLPHGDGDRGGS